MYLIQMRRANSNRWISVMVWEDEKKAVKEYNKIRVLSGCGKRMVKNYNEEIVMEENK